MNEKIKLPILFGHKSKNNLIGEGSCILTLTDKCLITRTCYSYEKLKDEDDELSERILVQLNEKTHCLKSAIIKIGVAWDEDEEINQVAFYFTSGAYYINVDSASEGNALLTKLVTWWLEEDK